MTDPALGRNERLSKDDAADVESIRGLAGDRPLDAQTPWFPADAALEPLGSLTDTERYEGERTVPYAVISVPGSGR